IHDPRVDVAESPQRKEIGRMLHVLEYIGCGLVNRRRARPGGRVRLRAGMDGKRVEAGSPVAHSGLSSRIKAGPVLTGSRKKRLSMRNHPHEDAVAIPELVLESRDDVKDEKAYSNIARKAVKSAPRD